MGSCSSTQKGRKSSSMVSSPHKQSEVQVVGSGFSMKRSEFGSTEETFFDSRAWLDSDCEDDFFSVNGDFTPSRGSTSNHQTSALSRAKSDKSFSFDKFMDYKSEPSPSPTGRKKLGDLFQEREQPNNSNDKLEANGGHDFSNKAKSDQSLNGANSMSNIVFTSNRDTKNKSKRAKATQCCLPSLSLESKRWRRRVDSDDGVEKESMAVGISHGYVGPIKKPKKEHTKRSCHHQAW